MTTTKIDFTTLTLKQLVAEYNTYTGKSRKALFANKVEGVAMVEAAYQAWFKTQPVVVETQPVAAEKKTKDAAERIVVNAPQCPYVRGQVAKDHFAVVQKSKTLGEYLGHYEKGAVRSYARAWLRLFANEGHVTLKAA
jgi:hypothetical protein